MEKNTRWLALVLALCLLMGSALALPAAAQDEPELPFTDLTPVEEDYMNFYRKAVDLGLMRGTTATTFSPGRGVTRAQAVTLLGRVHEKLEGVDLTEAFQGRPTGYPDVAPGSYYAPYAAWAKDLGLVQGQGDGSFAPGRGMSFEAMAVLLHRYLLATDRDGWYPPEEVSRDIAPWAQEAAAAVMGYGFFRHTGIFGGNTGMQRHDLCLLSVGLYEKLSYPRMDQDTPLECYSYYLEMDDQLYPGYAGEDGVVDYNRVMPMAPREARVLGSFEEYQALKERLFALKVEGSLNRVLYLERAPYLEVTAQTFENYDVLAVNLHELNCPSFSAYFAGLTVEEESAWAEFVCNRSGGYSADICGQLYFFQVPKGITTTGLHDLYWTTPGSFAPDVS
ncbi:MAG: S-layer homology domain-containing protein [Acutalibacter sp.]|nr:S-layer homology domain-containing protein [Acutalibacter sp.]